jgi:catechol 2,3-dioxygenase-like lactoylglutathione lyase family enzyme
MINYSGTLIVVSNIKKSKWFYFDILNLDVEIDNGDNVKLQGGIYLQTQHSWESFTGLRTNMNMNHNVSELYFEVDNIQEFAEKLNSSPDLQYVNRLKKEPWGQQTIRFYDPDGHIIEVGEKIGGTV